MVSKIERYRVSKSFCLRNAQLATMVEIGQMWLVLANSFQVLIEAEERDPTLQHEPATQVPSPLVAA